MNAHQLPSVGAADTDSFAKQNQRHSESTTANTRTQTIVGQMSERFDALDARLRKTAIISEGSVTAPGQKTMRKLVDWLLGICWNYSVDEVGLFLSVALLTNFVENRNVERKQLQAVAVTCLLIASKYTQVSKLRLKDAVDLCSGIYSVEQIAQFESQILQLHKFDLEVLTTNHYLNECIWWGGLREEERNELAFWLEVELLLQEEKRSHRQIFCDIAVFVSEDPENTNCHNDIITPASDRMKRLVSFAAELSSTTTVLKKHMSHFDTEAYVSRSLKRCSV